MHMGWSIWVASVASSNTRDSVASLAPPPPPPLLCGSTTNDSPMSWPISELHTHA